MTLVFNVVVNLFLTVTGKFSVTTGILPHVYGSRERHYHPATEMCVMFSISILCYFDSHHSCFIYINCSAVAMVLDQERD